MAWLLLTRGFEDVKCLRPVDESAAPFEDLQLQCLKFVYVEGRWIHVVVSPF